MSLLIKGMEMPKEGKWKTVRIYPDGTCAVPNWQGDCTLIKGAQAIPILPHGDLVDRDDLLLEVERGDYETYNDYSITFDLIDCVPTVIGAEDGER